MEKKLENIESELKNLKSIVIKLAQEPEHKKVVKLKGFTDYHATTHIIIPHIKKSSPPCLKSYRLVYAFVVPNYYYTFSRQLFIFYCYRLSFLFLRLLFGIILLIQTVFYLQSLSQSRTGNPLSILSLFFVLFLLARHILKLQLFQH